jgi:hypothetical protein
MRRIRILLNYMATTPNIGRKKVGIPRLTKFLREGVLLALKSKIYANSPPPSFLIG